MSQDVTLFKRARRRNSPVSQSAASLPALSHGLAKGGGEAELTIYLPFVFGRGWFGMKK